MSVSSGGGYVRDGHNYKTLSDSSAHTISQTFITRPYHRTLCGVRQRRPKSDPSHHFTDVHHTTTYHRTLCGVRQRRPQLKKPFRLICTHHFTDVHHTTISPHITAQPHSHSASLLDLCQGCRASSLTSSREREPTAASRRPSRASPPRSSAPQRASLSRPAAS
jgi:hypothetical protein